MGGKGKKSGAKSIDEAAEAVLLSLGIDLAELCSEGGEAKAKLVCVAADLSGSLRGLGSAARDQVVMVRVDEDTRRQLDAWVETGAVKSRSEAAALFIREGLNLRRSEIKDLEDALGDVEKAKKKLKEKAAKMFGQAGKGPKGSKGAQDSE